MKAVVFTGDSVRVDEVPDPRILEASDAIVKVDRTAICGSDLHLLSGHTPGMRTGGVIGHEFVGIVQEAGDETGFEGGERVLGSFLIACGACEPCSAGRFNHCTERRALGLGTLTGDLDGAQAEMVRVPVAAVNLLRLERHPADDAAIFCGDVLATAIYGAHLAGDVSGHHAVVIGAGPVGLLSAAALQRRGATPLLLDTDEERTRFATDRFGLAALHIGDGGADAMGAVAEATGGAMGTVTIDAVGHPSAFRSALKTTRDGGTVVVLGVYGSERYDLPMGMAWIRGLDIRFAGMANVQAHWHEALDAVTSNAIDPTVTITHRMPLDDAELGYELFAAREAMKVVLTP